MKYDKIIQHKWKGEGVKFLKKPLGWDKNYLRTANCKYCGKKAKEKFVNESFYGWALLPIASSVDGKHPEVCPECLVKIGMNLVVSSPRIQRCTKCGAVQKEKIFGLGWPGWVGLQSMKVLGKKTAPLICPDCYLELAKNLGAEYIRGTWTDLTYPYGSLLTSTKMTQNQANFTALAEAHAGAPNITYPLPIGSIIAWHKSLAGVPALPSSFMECDGSVINDADSPMDGETLPDLNGDGRFLRGSATSGTNQAESFKAHTHDIKNHGGNVIQDKTGVGDNTGYISTSPSESAGGTETRPINMSVVWIMRIK